MEDSLFDSKTHYKATVIKTVIVAKNIDYIDQWNRIFLFYGTHIWSYAFVKGTKAIQWRNNSPLTNSAGKAAQTCVKKRTSTYTSHIMQKLTPNGPKCKAITSRRTHRENLCDLRLS